MSAKEGVEIASRIFRDYGATIRRMVQRYVHSEQDVDDVYQNIFLSIVASPPTHETSLLAYFRVIVRNAVKDASRRAASRQGFAKRYGRFLETRAPGDGKESELEQTEQVSKTMTLLKYALPTYMARVLTERFVHGRGIDEIASQLGVDRRSVSRYCCVGLKRLRHLLVE